MHTQTLTPEERLLRLIETGNGDTKRPGFQDVRTWARRFFPKKEAAPRVAQNGFGAGAPKDLNLKLINVGFSIILGVLMVAIGVNTNRAQPSVKDLSTRLATSTPPAHEQPVVATLRPLGEYVGEVETRDLFHPAPPPKPKEPQPKVAAAAKPPEPAPLDNLREKVKTLKLVGIAWGVTPIAMIEDTARRETSFVKAGQVINQIKVKTILKDRVVLSHGAAEYDLF